MNIQQQVEELLWNSNISRYQISKDTGVSEQVLYPYAVGKSKIENMRLMHAMKLSDYYKRLIEEGSLMRVWIRNGYTVEEQEFDFDLHQFAVIKDDETVGIIKPAAVEDQKQIIANLDAGADVDGWEDGKGNTISL